MKTIFSDHGIPDVVYTGGGPCYSSREFEMFWKQWEFKHIMSSPHSHQSNGFAERMVQTTKLVIKKALRANTDIEYALLCVKATPIRSIINSPAEPLYNRQIRTNIPIKQKCDDSMLSKNYITENYSRTSTIIETVKICLTDIEDSLLPCKTRKP